MDVRILLRIGTKYALARGSIWVLRAALIVALIIFFLQTARNPHPGSLAVIRLLVFGLLLFLVSPRVFGPISNWIDRKFFRESYTADLVLSELSEQVRHFTETAPLIETVSRSISEVLHVPDIAVLLRGSEVFQLRYSVGLNALGPLLLPEKSAAVQHVLETNRPALLYRDRPEEWFIEADDREKRALNQMQAEVLLAFRGASA